MLEHRLKLTVVPWDDPGFHQLLDAACACITKERLDLDSREAADLVQRMLRAAGYADAVIEYHRTADDYLKARATWTVLRDGALPH